MSTIKMVLFVIFGFLTSYFGLEVYQSLVLLVMVSLISVISKLES